MSASVFSALTTLPDDPILSLTGKFLADPRDCKVNLGVGMYLDEKGQTPILEVVREAQEALSKENRPHTYIPQTGLPLYDRLVQSMIFGADSEVVSSKRACTMQTLAALEPLNWVLILCTGAADLTSEPPPSPPGAITTTF